MISQNTAEPQALGLYACQADEIRELLDEHAPHTTGNLVARISQLLLAKATAHAEDDALRRLWVSAGGSFHGVCIERGTAMMPEAILLGFLRTGVAPT